MSIAETVRALLGAHAHMLARRGLTELAARIADNADTLDSGGYAVAADTNMLLRQFSERAREITSHLMGVPADSNRVSGFEPRAIVDSQGDRIGVIELDDPDIDALMTLANNLIFAAMGRPLDPDPHVPPRVRMFGSAPEPPWAAHYPRPTPETRHRPGQLIPAELDPGRARLLTALTGTANANAALLCLRKARVQTHDAQTIHDGIRFDLAVFDRTFEVRICGADPCQLEVRLAHGSKDTYGVLDRDDALPLSALRGKVEAVLDVCFDHERANSMDADGIDATPPHPALLAAAAIRHHHAAPTAGFDVADAAAVPPAEATSEDAGGDLAI
ncbi:hypothetical protein [Nocardia asiatica]|uniref:hypothetical protein n=1 Tax=Nocardia asiatica TaxID=209252 RepID=UPI0002FBBE28|nr:hypothetical protein [Nocardia asiatica]